MVICGIDPDPAKADALKAWGRAYWEAVHPHNLGGGYLNFMMDDEAEGRVEASVAPGPGRLELPRWARSVLLEVDGRPYLRRTTEGLEVSQPVLERTADRIRFGIQESRTP